MKSQIEQVRNFMMVMSQMTRSQPTANLPVPERLLRVRLIQEELQELTDALGLEVDAYGFFAAHPSKPVNLVSALDGLTDLLYVIFGTYESLGLGHLAEAAFAEVHRSNLSKLQPDGTVLRNEGGKILKPETYSPPDLKQFFTNPPSTNPFDGAL